MAGVKGRSGGARVGAGRKRRDPAATWLRGNPGKRSGPRGVVKPPATAAGPAPAITRPKDMEPDAVAIWDELAPFALEQRTLTPATARAFAWLCRTIVLEGKLAAAPLAVAGPDHRGMMQRMEAGLARFRLTPDGKPSVVADAPADAFAEFDGPQLVTKGA